MTSHSSGPSHSATRAPLAAEVFGDLGRVRPSARDTELIESSGARSETRPAGGSTASLASPWWFGHDRDVAGFGLGATWLRATFSVAGTIQLDEISTSGSVSRTEEAVAPLVTLGYRHAFSDRLRIYLDASGVHKPSGRLTGHIYDARAGVEWFAWPNFGIGAEYGATQIELERHREPYSARLRLHLHGPSLFARLRF